MRKAIFEVPAEVIGDFVEKLTDLELNNTIIGLTDNEDLEIEVLYEKDESDEVDHLEHYLEKLVDSIEEDE